MIITTAEQRFAYTIKAIRSEGLSILQKDLAIIADSYNVSMTLLKEKTPKSHH